MAVVTKPISGTRKAAIVMMAIGEENASKLFKHLQEDEIERIAREVASIGSVPPEQGESVLAEFHQMASASDHISNGGVEHARRLLTKSLGPDQSRRILDRPRIVVEPNRDGCAGRSICLRRPDVRLVARARTVRPGLHVDRHAAAVH